MTPRSVRSAVLVLLALGGLAACTSTPGPKRVALDVVETLDIPQDAKDCMTQLIENEYSNEQLEQIGNGVDNGDVQSRADLDKFEADLADCVSGTR